MTRLPVLFCLLAAGCSQLAAVGRAPGFTPVEGSNAQYALYSMPLPEVADPSGPTDASSLWTAGSESLLGDRRAARRGDILTVVIEIDDSASISNATDTSRTGSQEMGVEALFGAELDAGIPLAPAVALDSNGRFAGDGSVQRNEQLTLRVAATVVDVLPNGVLQISGQQEVRVNDELRELLVSGYVRPADISRQNEVNYDKIAAARISYGGRGQITEAQNARWGQQALDHVLPF